MLREKQKGKKESKVIVKRVYNSAMWKGFDVMRLVKTFAGAVKNMDPVRILLMAIQVHNQTYINQWNEKGNRP